MAEVRLYKTVDISSMSAYHLAALKATCLGHNDSAPCDVMSLDNTLLFVKTTQELIDAKVAEGVSHDDIFPPGKVVDYTYENIKLELNGPLWLDPNDDPTEF